MDTVSNAQCVRLMESGHLTVGDARGPWLTQAGAGVSPAALRRHTGSPSHAESRELAFQSNTDRLACPAAPHQLPSSGITSETDTASSAATRLLRDQDGADAPLWRPQQGRGTRATRHQPLCMSYFI